MDQIQSAMAKAVQQALVSLLNGVTPQLLDHHEQGQSDELGELCKATNHFIRKFAEAAEFLSSLSSGRLEIEPPRRNFLISPFKRLHSSLRHLTWQTKQVASGDLSQRVDFLGEFSDAFNSMIDSLKEKREIELALKRSEERLGLAIDGADLGLWDYDIGSGEVVFNRRWAEMLGYDLQSIAPRISSWHELIHPEDEAGFMASWEAHLKCSTSVFRVEHRLRANAGDWKWILCIGKIVDHDSSGSPKRVAGIFIDITERKLAEAKLQEAHASLIQANTEIMDSIRYARTIQTAFLPNPQELASNLGDYFIIWEPKELIGGDIYKYKTVPEGFLLSVIDCTGHGVPGAIMTMISGASLDRAVEEVGYKDPALLLTHLNRLVKNSLNQHQKETSSDDGLDIGICFVNKPAKSITFAGARIGLWCLRQGELHELRPDRQSIGYKTSGLSFSYANRAVSFDDKTTFYICTDGLLHQTGGPRRLPFGKKRFKRLILDNCEKPLYDQMRAIREAIETYRGDEPQLDDITIVGFNPFTVPGGQGSGTIRP